MWRLGLWNQFLKYLTIQRPVPPVSLEHRVPHSPPWISLGGAEGQQLPQHKVQSLPRQMANALVVQSLSVRLFVTQWTAAHQASQSFTISQSLVKLMSIESVMPSNHLCRPLLFLSSIFPASRSFLMSQLFEQGGQSIGDSASSSLLSMNIQGWFPLVLTGLIFLQFKGL